MAKLKRGDPGFAEINPHAQPRTPSDYPPLASLETQSATLSKESRDAIIARVTGGSVDLGELIESMEAPKPEADDYEVHALGIPNGVSVRFNYSPKSYIEYAIAHKAIADLTKEMDHCAIDANGSIEIGLATQQETIRDGLLVKHEGSELLTCRVATNPENSTYYIVFHSYNKKLTKKYAKRFRQLCCDSNFFKGKHLKAQHLHAQPPLKFLEPPVVPVIYGFKDILESVHQNTIGFFKCKAVHKIAMQRGVLLHGKPGSGKSSIICKTKAECLAEGITVIDFDSDAMSQVAQWYGMIEEWLAPALVVLEDFDLIGQSRDVGRSPEAITTDLLASLGGNQKKKLPVVTIATTNRLSALDSAVTRARRMDKIFEVSGMADEFKIQLFKQKGLAISEALLKKAVQNLGEEGTGADVEEISASTTLYCSLGISPDEAFDKALKEWEEAHQIKSKHLGF